MANDIVNTILPKKVKEKPKPINPEHEEDLS
jgi:hypothetical protein